MSTVNKELEQQMKDVHPEKFKPLNFDLEKSPYTPVKPLGHHVLIEIIPVNFKSTGGIILTTEKEGERERKGRDLAKIVAFGPIAYQGFGNCTCPADWGVKIGDTVELSGRYDGKFSSVHEYDSKYKNLRYVADNDIIGVLDKEIVNQLIKEDK